MAHTNQLSFHPMNGHVAHGITVKMDNGDILTIKSSMRGWNVCKDNEILAQLPASAFEVAKFIGNYKI